MGRVLVRFYAAAREAVGNAEVEVPPGSLAQILQLISDGNPRLTHVLLRCSFLIDGTVCHDMRTEIVAGSTLDVLPPFAGG